MAWTNPWSATGSKSYAYNVPANSTGYNRWFFETPYNVANSISKTIYDTTGYDPAGGSSYDYYGRNVNRGIATTLDSARTAQYDAASRQLANQFAVARTRANQSAQARGLSKSGFAAEQERQLSGQQADAQSQVYANLLADEQKFLDALYMEDKATATKVALMEQAMAEQRKIAFQDTIAEIISGFSDLAKTAGSLATLIPMA